MDICKALDLAIMKKETDDNSSISAGYRVAGRKEPYGNYLSDASWKKIKEEMETDYPQAFEAYAKGGGKELEERKVKGRIYPPKMASFGSSSRMIFKLMKDVTGFELEKKLATAIGGTANLDGYFENAEKRVFVEAKCREPYGSKSGSVSKKYFDLYRFLSDSTANNFSCTFNGSGDKTVVRVSAGDTPLEHFDIKQMICHLLGIANDCLKKKDGKKIEFIYLLYNPANLKFEDLSCEKKIRAIYDLESKECDAVDFKGLFSDILVFLQKKDDTTDIQTIAQNFSFKRCDQDSMTL